MLQGLYKGKISNVRGAGTLVAFDLPTPADRDAVVVELRARGVDIPTCGDRTIRCRPGLFFSTNHAKIFLEALEDAVVAHYKLSKQ